MVFDKLRKKKTQEEMQDEIDALLEEEKRLDLKIGYDKISKRVADKRRSQSVAGKIGKGIKSAADTVFGGPPKKTSNKKSSTSKKKKKEDDWFIPFI